jgi:glutathione S-transferase
MKLGEGPPMTLTLYDVDAEPQCYAVRLMLGLLRLPHERFTIGQSADPCEPARVPFGHARDMPPPVLVDDTLVLCEVDAILAYLARRYDWRDQWLPADDPKLFGRTMMWLSTAARTLRTLGQGQSRVEPPVLVRTMAAILGMMEDHLAARQDEGETWFVGRTPTIADVVLFAITAFVSPADRVVGSYPAVHRWMMSFRALPGLVAAPALVPRADPPARLPASADSLLPAPAADRAIRRPKPLDVARGSELVFRSGGQRPQRDWFKLTADRPLS